MEDQFRYFVEECDNLQVMSALGVVISVLVC